MFSIGINPFTERWIVWNDNLCKPANGASYATEQEAIEALRKMETRAFSHSPQSYFSRVLMSAH